MKPFAFHPEASEEFNETLRHYADIDPVLSGRFYDEIERLIAEVCERPKIFRVVRPPVRRHFTTEYPHGILYVDRPDDVWIVAVIPLKREPDYWLHRLN